MLRSGAAGRNKEPILEILRLYLEDGNKKVLELASGTGEHIAHWAPALPPTILWQPSECEPRALHSICAYLDHYRWPNVRVPLFIDVTKGVDRWALPDDFGPGSVDAIIVVNLLHITTDAAVRGVFQAANGLLRPDVGRLIVYGPFAINGVLSPQSNVDFDLSLRSQNKEWGIRDTRYLTELAKHNGLLISKIHDMPANNKTIIFSRR